MQLTDSRDLKRKKKLGMIGIGCWLLATISILAYFYFEERRDHKIPISSQKHGSIGLLGTTRSNR